MFEGNVFRTGEDALRQGELSSQVRGEADLSRAGANAMIAAAKGIIEVKGASSSLNDKSGYLDFTSIAGYDAPATSAGARAGSNLSHSDKQSDQGYVRDHDPSLQNKATDSPLNRLNGLPSSSDKQGDQGYVRDHDLSLQNKVTDNPLNRLNGLPSNRSR